MAKHSRGHSPRGRPEVGVALLVAFLLGAPAQAQTSDPAVGGSWSPVKSWPMPAVHTLLLPTGKVMFYPEYEHGDEPHLWDPVTDTLTNLPPAGYNIFCSGHSFLADGKLLISGGHVVDYVGLANASLYDPFSNTWTPLHDMNAGRWYPTNTTLANGDVLVISGTIDITHSNLLPQVWETANNRWRDLTNAELFLPTYPWMFLAPNGKVFLAGPWENTRYLDTSGTGTWTTVGRSNNATRSYGSAVMYDEGKVLISGGASPPTNTAEVIDLNAARPAWRNVSPMKNARRQHNALLLPDGQVLIVGGSGGPGFNNAAFPVYQAELWNPATETFTPLASNARFRGYHSTAVLLQDGRVLFAGGRYEPSMEVYSPPYLFKGARPGIANAPASVHYGETFTVATPDAARVAQVNWLRLNAVTHSFDQNQRINRLSFTKGSGTLSVTAPSNPALCPPGHYQLFILDAKGVPSVSRIIQIGGTAPAASLAVTAPNGGETLAAGVPYTLRWQTNGAIPNVKLEYSLDSGTSWTSIASAWANSGQYAWSVPDSPTTQGLVRVSSALAPATSDTSNAPFTIARSTPPVGLLFEDDFARTIRSGLGPDWNVATGLWLTNGQRAISDRTAPTGDMGTESRASCGNCRVEVDVTSFAVPEAGAFLRAPSTGSLDRYDAILTATGQLQIRLVRSGAITVLGTAASGLAHLDAPARLALAAQGAGPVVLTASVNGQVALTVTDTSASALKAPGYAGLWTTVAGVWFDHFQLWSTP